MDSMDVVDAAALPHLKSAGYLLWLRRYWQVFVSWLLTWEIYPILALALFTHLYQLSTTEFDADQAILFRLPRAAVLQGLIPATGTVSSIGMVNPPGYVYLLMPVAAFTASPFASMIFTALLNVLAVVLTYVFTRRYYGRLAGITAALLYTTTLQDIYYGRFIWQPNLLPFFVLLFFLALFRGAVERKTGWLAPALGLLGFMLQLHATPLYLCLPLAVAVLLAYQTVRLRDVITGLIYFSLFFLPYLVWEFSSRFVDLAILLGASGQVPTFDNQALRFYMSFLAPYVGNAGNSHAVLRHFLPFLRREAWLMYIVTTGGFLLALLGIFGWKHIQFPSHTRFRQGQPVLSNNQHSRWQKIRAAWNDLVFSPQRCGLLLLLTWQIPVLLLLSRHTITLQAHYLLILLPGPFILIGLLISQVTAWCKSVRNWGKLLRFAAPALSLCLIMSQFIGSSTWFLDESRGTHSHWHTYDTWQDMQGVVNAADQLAQSHHLHHVYIYTDQYTDEAFTYLAGQMKTPVTLISRSNCLILPASWAGPAVALVGPADPLDESLLKHFSSAQFMSSPPRLGGAPFHLYIVQPMVAPLTDAHATFTQMLAMDKGRHKTLTYQNPNYPSGQATQLFGMFWTSLRNWPARYRTFYTYKFSAHYAGNGTNGEAASATCSFDNLEAGEQMFVPFALPVGSLAWPTSLALSGSLWKSQPDILASGPLRFESIRDQYSFQSYLGKSFVVQN
ncbi:MAG TPA: glycosyltransferase family 39 protein [Ktedonobacteraceae bacterium]|nr:glycosyltransferase family 39 protein [Ktedonobacteraceae bacterium]